MQTLNSESEEKENNAIVPARKPVTLGNLHAASPALESVRMGVASAALDLTKQMGWQAAEQLRVSVAALSLDATEHLRRNLGVSQGVNDMIRDLSGRGIGERLESVHSMGLLAAGQTTIGKQLSEQIAQQAAKETARTNQMFSQLSEHIAADQRQRREAMQVAFEELRSWQQPWPEHIPRQWEVYEPEVDQPLITLESIEMELKQGRLSVEKLEKLLQQYKRAAPEPISPDKWAEIEFVALAYKEHGGRYESQDTFIQAFNVKYPYFTLSLPAFKRKIAAYERETGERIRPGRGRAKRSLPKRRKM